MALCFFATPFIPLFIKFSGDEDERYEELHRPHSCQTAFNPTVHLDGEEEIKIGSTMSFKELDGHESVELHGYVQDENPIHRE